MTPAQTTYYAPLVAAWNSGTQPPTGVTGAALLGGDTTAQKIAKVNAWTVTGSVPASMVFTGSQLANCINFAEFFALAAAAQTQVMQLCALPGPLLGGSANVAFLPVGVILKYFPVAGPTVAALTALAQGTVQPWWQSVGLNGQVSLSDTTIAGLT